MTESLRHRAVLLGMQIEGVNTEDAVRRDRLALTLCNENVGGSMDGKKMWVAACCLVTIAGALASCGNAPEGASASDVNPEPAPSAFGEVDILGADLQCDTRMVVQLVPDFLAEAAGYPTPQAAAESYLIEALPEDQVPTFSDATEFVVTAAGSYRGGVESEGGGSASVVEVDAIDRNGAVKAIVMASPEGEDGAWIATGLHICEDGQL